MRWEEMWDAALRIRNLFLPTPLPDELRAALAEPVAARFADVAAVVRSSAPGEDWAAASFAGLHESYVNVRGVDAILEHVKLVWASLWSDARAALPARARPRPARAAPWRSSCRRSSPASAPAWRSAATRSDEERALVEAVHGLNQGLVDGTVEPDRWTLDRARRRVLEHRAAERREMMAPAADGVRLVALPERPRRDGRRSPADELPACHGAGAARRGRTSRRRRTWSGRCAATSSSRCSRVPSPPCAGAAGDGRAVYLSLRRSFDNLQRRCAGASRTRRSRRWSPRPSAWRRRPLDELDDRGLLRGRDRRRKAEHDRWVDVYSTDFIPFAHGARLFGHAYNDALRPDDPYEFVDLLHGDADGEPAPQRRPRARRRGAARRGRAQARPRSPAYVAEFGDRVRRRRRASARRRSRVARRLAARPAGGRAGAPRAPSASRGLPRAAPAGGARARRRAARPGARELAPARRRQPLPRAARGPLSAALAEMRRRGLAVDARPRAAPHRAALAARRRGAGRPDRRLPPPGREPSPGPPGRTRPAPASAARPGRSSASPPAPALPSARRASIAGRDDLLAFEDGEILVCDAIDPKMTFVVPLAAGIVERRGGMLIHGAIIAREYGLPCVTGVPRATELIKTGDRVTVDGYLGIVVVG